MERQDGRGGAVAPPTLTDAFVHRALLYRGERAYLNGLVPFISEGLEGDEGVLVATTPDKIAVLRGALGRRADAVEFVDMRIVGRNPARIIPLWSDHLERCRTQGRRARGVGEPVHGWTDENQRLECAQHEALLNVAFDGSVPWSLLCPYDADVVGAAAIEAACCTHPTITTDDAARPSERYDPTSARVALAGPPLPPAPPSADELVTHSRHLQPVRRHIAAQASRHGVDPARTADLVLAASEIVTNSIWYGGGTATVRSWADGTDFVVEISDAGHITDSLAGRRRPPVEQVGGRGLWIANVLCDLVQLRSDASGTVVRLHVGADAAGDG
jgi:anti-sigma regulatory factor (Ser/Thr protein kinase)